MARFILRPYICSIKNQKIMRFLSLLFSVVVSVAVFGQVPTITSFTPASGDVGSSVVLTGTNFDATAANNIVYFGSVKAVVTAASTTSLTVTVPAGSTYASMTVLTAGKQGSSKTPFMVTNTAIAGLPYTSSSFSTTTISPTGVHGYPSDWVGDDMAVGDFDLDGKTDVVKYSNGASVDVNRNTSTPGTVSFAAAVAFSVSAYMTNDNAMDISVGDVNNDGKLDIVVIKSHIIVLINNSSAAGTISFATPIALSISTEHRRIDLSDVNNDGFLDFIYSDASYNSNATQIKVKLNSGTAAIFSATAATNLTVVGHKHFSLADLNNDNLEDIIVSNSTGTTSYVYLNSTSGGSVSFGTAISLASTGNRNNYPCDINLDGTSDLFSNYTTATTSPAITTNQFTTGSFSASSVSSASSGITVSTTGDAYLALGNIDGDTKLDAISLVYPTGFNGYALTEAKLMTGYNAGAFATSTNVLSLIPTNNTATTLIFDVDGDNKQDFVNARGYYTSFHVIKNNITAPPIAATPNTLTGFSTCAGTVSASQTTSISGTGLSANITLTAPSGYEISLSSASGYASSLTLTQTGGVVNATTIYVRLNATATAGTYNANLTAVSGSNTTNIALTGVKSLNTAGAASSNPTLCINTALTNITLATTGATNIGTATGLPAGVTAAWATNTITLSGTPTASGAFNYSIPLTGGCGTVNATGTITVTPDMIAGAASSTPTACFNAAITNITHATTGATGIGSATGLPAGVTASWATNTITISGTPTATGTFNYTIPLTGGCGTVNATGTITVNGANTVGTASSTPSICTGSTMTAITHTTTGATGFGYPSGLPGGLNVSFSSNTLTISGNPSTTYSVGNYYNGGRIAYIFQPSDNGYVPGKVLIVDPLYKTGPTCTDKWTVSSSAAVTSSSIGEGLNNTNALYSAGHTSTSQAVGWAYAYSDGVYSDWFVPSKDELAIILTNLPSYYASNGSYIRSSTQSSSYVSPFYTSEAYIRSGGSISPYSQNAGGCANLVIARYDVLPAASASNTYNYTIPLTGGCGSASATGTITLSTDTYTWTGATSTSPTVASNWNPASVPCDGANKIIPTGLTNYPTYTTLNINSGSSFTLQTGARMTVTGLLTNNGSLTVESGATLLFTGGLAGNGTYTVKQNITDCANDGSAPTGRFWYMGIPLTSMTRANAFGTAGTMNRLWQWSEGSQAWSSQIADNTSLSASTGYVLRLGSNTTLNFTGTNLYNANSSFSGLTNTAGSFGGCHLFANSNLGYLDWHTVYGAGVSSTYCVRSYNTTNSQMVYDTYNAVGTVAVQNSSYAVTRYIAPMQSFWIRVNPSTTGAISINKTNLSHQPTATGLKEITEFPAFARLNLVDGTFSDQVVVYTDVNADAEVEDHDSKKFFLPNVAQVYCKVGNDKLVINALKKGKAQISAPLTIELPATKVYKFEMAESFVENGLVILEDKQEGIFQDMGVNPSYEFYSTSGVIADRFVLHFQLPNGTNNEGQAGVEEVASSTINVISNQNGAILVSLSADLTATGEVQILDAAGRMIQTTTINGQDTKLQVTEGTGVYFVRVLTPMKSETKKVLVY